MAYCPYFVDGDSFNMESYNDPSGLPEKCVQV